MTTLPSGALTRIFIFLTRFLISSTSSPSIYIVLVIAIHSNCTTKRCENIGLSHSSNRGGPVSGQSPAACCLTERIRPKADPLSQQLSLVCIFSIYVFLFHILGGEGSHGREVTELQLNGISNLIGPFGIRDVEHEMV